MDQTVLSVLRYAADRSKETLDLYERGKITEQQACIRYFLLGKILIGWESDDERSDLEILETLLNYNRLVMASVDETAGLMAS